MTDIDYTTPAIIPDDELEARTRIEWHVRMARAKQAELDDTERQYKAELDRIRERLANRKRILEAEIEWHAIPVESWHRFRLEYGVDKRASVEMVHGISKITTPKKPKVTIDDEGDCHEDIHQWLLDHHPDSLGIPNISTLRSLVQVQTDDAGANYVLDKDTGEVLPFFVAAIPEPTYKLSLEEGAPIE